MTLAKIYASFDAVQVEQMNRCQKFGSVHPFTCTCGNTLLATEAGWRCNHCPDYRQDWAFAIWPTKKPSTFSARGMPTIG
jgi:hypothetical protein